MVTDKVEEHGCESERESYNVMGVLLTYPGFGNSFG
jgi:hypothetical protein